MRRPLLWLVIAFATVLAACDNGVTREYWDNGKLKSELRYANGRLNGECLWYDRSGTPQVKANYRDDTLEGPYQRWHLNGQLSEEGWYKHGLRDSICRSYSERGVLTSEDHYTEGKLDGESRKWYDNGQIFQEGQYVDGLMVGSWFFFYPSGAMGGKGEFQRGSGKQIGYDESGYKCLEVSYVDNLKQGKEIHYNPVGDIIQVVEYEHGVKVDSVSGTQKTME